MSITGIKGFNDILPGEVEKWQHIEAAARRVFGLYGFSEIRVPILEKTELFCRSIGDSTDIVEKEMYSFVDKGENKVTMRPEGTASIMRASSNTSFMRLIRLPNSITWVPCSVMNGPKRGVTASFTRSVPR